ncbi:MAG: GDSL-type esterase/lipase family protein [Acidimicrobiia bacterium]
MVPSLIKRGAIAGTMLVGIETAYALFRPSPYQPDFDPSGEFGDPSHPDLRVAVLGDSSVTAPGVTGPDEIWITIICDRLSVNRHVILQSFAVGGSRAGDLIDAQMDVAVDFRPDIVFVSVGANDTITGVPRRQFEDNLDYLIGGLAETGAVVIQSGVGDLGSIPRLYPPLSNMVSRRAHGFDQAHWRVAARHGTAVVRQRSDDSGRWYKDRGLWSPDLFHVSAAGHARWAETIWETVEPLIPESNGSH